MFSKNDSEKEAISDIQMLENSSSADLHIKKILKKFPPSDRENSTRKKSEYIKNNRVL